MFVLGLDTSSAAVTVGIRALADDDHDGQSRGPSATRVHVNARAHGELLAPAIEECLIALGIRARDVGAVVAGVGPGPFTGLRVGLVTAAAYADALDIPTYGVCSLDAIAPIAGGPILVAGDARRREVYWARYSAGIRIGTAAVDKPADVPRDGLTAMVGAGARLYSSVFDLPLLDNDYPDVGRLIEFARERVLTRAPSENLTPLYLRRPDAVEPGPAKAVRS
jgi:tRNA threonylcarbamoyl adenosine modification protein YeaZ